MVSPIGGAASGLSAQFQRFERSAARIAGGAGSAQGPDYVAEAVEQMSVEKAVKANIAVIKAADEMVGTLLDIWV